MEGARSDTNSVAAGSYHLLHAALKYFVIFLRRHPQSVRAAETQRDAVSLNRELKHATTVGVSDGIATSCTMEGARSDTNSVAAGSYHLLHAASKKLSRDLFQLTGELRELDWTA